MTTKAKNLDLTEAESLMRTLFEAAPADLPKKPEFVKDRHGEIVVHAEKKDRAWRVEIEPHRASRTYPGDPRTIDGVEVSVHGVWRGIRTKRKFPLGKNRTVNTEKVWACVREFLDLLINKIEGAKADDKRRKKGWAVAQEIVVAAQLPKGVGLVMQPQNDGATELGRLSVTKEHPKVTLMPQSDGTGIITTIEGEFTKERIQQILARIDGQVVLQLSVVGIILPREASDILKEVFGA